MVAACVREDLEFASFLESFELFDPDAILNEDAADQARRIHDQSEKEFLRAKRFGISKERRLRWLDAVGRHITDVDARIAALGPDQKVKRLALVAYRKVLGVIHRGVEALAVRESERDAHSFDTWHDEHHNYHQTRQDISPRGEMRQTHRVVSPSGKYIERKTTTINGHRTG